MIDESDPYNSRKLLQCIYAHYLLIKNIVEELQYNSNTNIKTEIYVELSNTILKTNIQKDLEVICFYMILSSKFFVANEYLTK